ncbi:MAG: YjcG family protein [Firmicutes bacterium]|uniref:Putative phosphoesterase SAMN04488112_101119 n=1 Tax=Melghirimyces thermohalophilus TaxID=1236220 RepID=A0A1G6HPX7_9BACL|nr:YjcG family protein [Melghirimyces thermohalophilus]MDA8351953.1 YjcG family protein [Bacillota bacterium]SDB95905.1 2'-5' RNA ligase [Melghirimyces thermohalophilus]
MRYGVATFPEKKIQDFANSYRKRYDPHYALIPPHITLKEPFELNEDMLPQALQHLEQVAKETSAFTVRLPKISTFHPTNNVIYIAVDETEAVKNLHEKINRKSIYHEEEYSYIPHITLAQKLSDSELHDVYGSLKMLKVEFETRIDRFHLLYQLENGSWTIYQSFLLQE